MAKQPKLVCIQPELMPGDANLDGKVDIQDQELTNYDKSIGASAVGVKAMPEPLSLVLLGIGVVGLFAYA